MEPDKSPLIPAYLLFHMKHHPFWKDIFFLLGSLLLDFSHFRHDPCVHEIKKYLLTLLPVFSLILF